MRKICCANLCLIFSRFTQAAKKTKVSGSSIVKLWVETVPEFVFDAMESGIRVLGHSGALDAPS